jgi:hypothetical protein
MLGAIPEEGTALGLHQQFEPTSAFWREYEQDVPLIGWARRAQSARL